MHSKGQLCFCCFLLLLSAVICLTCLFSAVVTVLCFLLDQFACILVTLWSSPVTGSLAYLFVLHKVMPLMLLGPA